MTREERTNSHLTFLHYFDGAMEAVQYSQKNMSAHPQLGAPAEWELPFTPFKVSCTKRKHQNLKQHVNDSGKVKHIKEATRFQKKNLPL